MPETAQVTEPVVRDERHAQRMVVNITALDVRKCDDGSFDLTIQGSALTDAGRKMLATLFPHCGDQIGLLLQTEALIDSINNQ
jgi:hypothetical protein